MQRYGGLSIYIAKADSVIRSARDEKIRRDFNGYNFKFLVNKYNLSERTIRSITAEIRQEKAKTLLSRVRLPLMKYIAKLAETLHLYHPQYIYGTVIITDNGTKYIGVFL